MKKLEHGISAFETSSQQGYFSKLKEITGHKFVSRKPIKHGNSWVMTLPNSKDLEPTDTLFVYVAWYDWEGSGIIEGYVAKPKIVGASKVVTLPNRLFRKLAQERKTFEIAYSKYYFASDENNWHQANVASVDDELMASLLCACGVRHPIKNALTRFSDGVKYVMGEKVQCPKCGAQIHMRPTILYKVTPSETDEYS